MDFGKTVERDWGKVKNCGQFSYLKKKNVVYAVNSSHRNFHNSASESVINFVKKHFDQSQ